MKGSARLCGLFTLKTLKMGCIYKLIDGDTVVYIGQTKSPKPYGRVFDHAKEKVFTHYEFSNHSNELLDQIERDEIARLTPKYNKNLNNKHDRKTGANISLLDDKGRMLWRELQLRVALQPSTAHLSDSFKDFMDHYRFITA